MSEDRYLRETPMLDFTSHSLQDLIQRRNWYRLSERERIGAAYDFTRTEIGFGYNQDDSLPASRVLADGYGQCNTKATLLMALLRGLGIACRLHGFTIHKGLQRGVVPELVYWMAPRDILHSWVEVQWEGRWVHLEGFILDQEVLIALQRAFPDRNSLCAYGAGTDCLQNPQVQWQGQNTYIQRTGINADLGLFDAPDDFYARHQQQLNGLRGVLYRSLLRHWMNRRVAAIRRGQVPTIPGGTAALEPGPAPTAFGNKNKDKLFEKSTHL